MLSLARAGWVAATWLALGVIAAAALAEEKIAEEKIAAEFLAAAAFLPDGYQALLVKQPLPVEAQPKQADSPAAAEKERGDTTDSRPFHVTGLANAVGDAIGRVQLFVRAAWPALEDETRGCDVLEVFCLAGPLDRDRLFKAYDHQGASPYTVHELRAHEFRCDTRAYYGSHVVVCLVEPKLLVVASSRRVLQEAFERRGAKKEAAQRAAGMVAAAKGIDTKSLRWGLCIAGAKAIAAGVPDVPAGIKVLAYSWNSDSLGLRFVIRGRGASVFEGGAKWLLGYPEGFGGEKVAHDKIRFDPGGTDETCSGVVTFTKEQFFACHFQLLALSGFILDF